MINTAIKYDFNQIEFGLLAFIGNLELKLQKIVSELPTFVLQTGDTGYLINEKFVLTENKEIYEKIPRFVINFDSIQYQSDQNTNQYNKFVYMYEGVRYLASGRRLAILIPVNTDFVSSNFIKGLENFEVMSTIIAKDNVFTYDFLGNTFEAAYVFQNPDIEKPSMDFGAGTRNFSVKTSFDLQLHLLVPRIESIKLLSESGFEGMKYEGIITGDNGQNKFLMDNNQ